MTPWETRNRATTTESGKQDVERLRTRSCQKLPSLAPAAGDDAADQGDHDAIPTAAETKFCTASPAIWAK